MKSRPGVSIVGWRCLEAAAGLLAPLERDVVLGDLAEMDRGAWRGLSDVLGLAARRQLALWKSWRPWAASFALSLPASLFLMGWSVAASGAIASLLREPVHAPLLWLSFSSLFLVVAWAWMAGFVVAAVSRGTLWASMLGGCAPCLYCLSKWPAHGLSGMQLLIFVVPALWGVWRGRRDLQLDMGWAVFLAAVGTLAPVLWGRSGCWLLWPGWYLVATARQKQE
jgi:hypothetical protein